MGGNGKESIGPDYHQQSQFSRGWILEVSRSFWNNSNAHLLRKHVTPLRHTWTEVIESYILLLEKIETKMWGFYQLASSPLLFVLSCTNREESFPLKEGPLPFCCLLYPRLSSQELILWTISIAIKQEE